MANPMSPSTFSLPVIKAAVGFCSPSKIALNVSAVRQIAAIWENSGSPARDLLLQRGKDALEDGDAEAALDHFSALIDHAPDFAAGYNGRATAYFLLGLYGPSLNDLRQTLVLEPRHFGAMRGLAVIAV